MQSKIVQKLKAALIMFFVVGITALLLTKVNTAAETSAERKRLPIYGVNTDEKTVALSFDCAWENSDTDILLEILRQNEVPATFFVTGDWCERYPLDVKKFYGAGHAVENHSYNHPHPNKLSREGLIEDTVKCNEIIESLTGEAPTLYRAPYGEYNNSVIETVEDELGLKVIQWDLDSRDWQKRSSEEMVRDIRDNIREGTILLFHNDTKNTPNTLRQIIPVLKGEGYEFMLISDMIYKENYTLDNEGRQRKTESEQL